jgi:hypothetical protein
MVDKKRLKISKAHLFSWLVFRIYMCGLFLVDSPLSSNVDEA